MASNNPLLDDDFGLHDDEFGLDDDEFGLDDDEFGLDDEMDEMDEEEDSDEDEVDEELTALEQMADTSSYGADPAFSDHWQHLLEVNQANYNEDTHIIFREQAAREIFLGWNRGTLPEWLIPDWLPVADRDDEAIDIMDKLACQQLFAGWPLADATGHRLMLEKAMIFAAVFPIGPIPGDVDDTWEALSSSWDNYWEGLKDSEGFLGFIRALYTEGWSASWNVASALIKDWIDTARSAIPGTESQNYNVLAMYFWFRHQLAQYVELGAAVLEWGVGDWASSPVGGASKLLDPYDELYPLISQAWMDKDIEFLRPLTLADGDADATQYPEPYPEEVVAPGEAGWKLPRPSTILLGGYAIMTAAAVLKGR